MHAGLASLPPPETADSAVEFTMRLGDALHRFGVPAHRHEELMAAVAKKLGLEGRFYSTPTAIFASFGPAEQLRTALIRVQPGELDLGRLADLDELTDEFLRGERTVSEARARLDALLSTPKRARPVLTTLMSVIAAGAGARLFGGHLPEMAAAAGLSLVIGPLISTSRFVAAARALEPLSALVASLGAVLIAHWMPLSVEVTTMAALIQLLPGLTLTIALTEIATRNLVSGTTRLLSAAMVFLLLAFGVAMGGKVGELLVGPSSAGPPPTPPDWTTMVALVVGAFAFAVLFRSRRKDLPWIVAAGMAAFVGSRYASRLFGPELGAFAGALALGVGSNLAERLRKTPAVVTTLPALMMLVPGSVGFRSLGALLQQDVTTGVATAFSMSLVGTAIVAGLLLSNAVVAPRDIS